MQQVVVAALVSGPQLCSRSVVAGLGVSGSAVGHGRWAGRVWFACKPHSIFAASDLLAFWRLSQT